MNVVIVALLVLVGLAVIYMFCKKRNNEHYTQVEMTDTQNSMGPEIIDDAPEQDYDQGDQYYDQEEYSPVELL